MLGPDEWWLVNPARTLPMPATKLREWVVRGWLHARQSPAQGLWIVWADCEKWRVWGNSSRRVRRGINATEVLHHPKSPRPTEVGKRKEMRMAARRFSQLQKRLLAWLAADARRTGGVIWE